MNDYLTFTEFLAQISLSFNFNSTNLKSHPPNINIEILILFSSEKIQSKKLSSNFS
jgi:hypothetical protein